MCGLRERKGVMKGGIKASMECLFQLQPEADTPSQTRHVSVGTIILLQYRIQNTLFVCTTDIHDW
jgi:hypothetical protein